MADFQLALEKLLDLEGRKLTNDPNDPGGQTYYGISRRAFPRWMGWAIIDSGGEPHIDLVADLYKSAFWEPLRCDEMTYPIAFKLFSMAVNVGQGDAVKFLQLALDVHPDGKLGPVTMAALAKADPRRLLIEMAGHQLLHYTVYNPRNIWRGLFNRAIDEVMP